jgi:hypothetical protein
MWFFSGVCLFGAIITIFFIPETKGKSLIQTDVEECDVMLNPTDKKVQIIPKQKLKLEE